MNEVLTSVSVLSMRFCYFIIFLFIASDIVAQDSTFTYTGSVLFAGANSQTPFWVYANQNGVIPMSGSFAVGRSGVYKTYNVNNPRIFQWSAGAELIASYSGSPKVFASDWFAAVKIGIVEIMAGQRKNITGLVDTVLTSGSLSVAGNSRPLPRAEIAIPRFYPLAFTNYFVSVKASYSDGLLSGTNINYGSSKYISQTYFHQKSVYLRFGNTHGKLTGLIGINHQAIWGGENKLIPLYNLKQYEAYWHVISGKTFHAQKIGNHFGTIDLGIQWKSSKWAYFAYRQNIYENGSLFRVINFTDGLNGLSIKRMKTLPVNARYFAVHSFLLEVVGTKSQINRHPFSNLTIFENGNYYNHYIYANGWSYQGNNIGTPLVADKDNIKKDGYYSNAEFTSNNRLWAFHAGLRASWLNINLLLKGTYSRNFGTYISPFEKRRDQFSFIASGEKKLPIKLGLIIMAGIASDLGHLYSNSTGCFAAVKKEGFLN